MIGFDIEQHRYPRRLHAAESEDTKRPGLNWSDRTKRGSKDAQFNRPPEVGTEWTEYPAQLVLQDVLTLHGSQFKDAALIVASPPCQEYSYMAMPWSRAKAIAAEYRSGVRNVKQLTALFDACFRIQREASEAAGHSIPLVVENVRGAIPWVGRSRWNFGSFHLWGDVPALMPMTKKHIKVDSFRFDGSGRSFQSASVGAIKNNGGSWFNIGSPGQKEKNRNPVHELNGTKQSKSGRAWFADKDSISGSTSSKSSKRKAASAMIAKIPLVLARHIAATYYPREANDAA